MTVGPSPIRALVACVILCLSAWTAVQAEDSRPDKALASSPVKTPKEVAATSSRSTGGAPLDVRVKNASTVEVITAILGVEVGTSLASAHERLDKLSAPASPPKEEAEEGEKGGRSEGKRKILWRFSETDYSALFVKSDEKQEITSITALLRPGNELPFEKIGEPEKAPIRTKSEIAWDVLRENRPLIRVIAAGAEGKAKRISIFLVKRRR